MNKVSRLEMARVLAGDKMKTDQPRLSLASCEGQKMKRREHGDQKKWREDDREEACMENATQETGALVGRVLDHILGMQGEIELPMAQVGFEGFSCEIELPMAASEFVIRIEKYARCSPPCFILAVILLQRLGFVDLEQDAAFKSTRLTRYNIQRLLLTSVMIASKVMERSTVDGHVCLNKHWCKIGGIQGTFGKPLLFDASEEVSVLYTA